MAPPKPFNVHINTDTLDQADRDTVDLANIELDMNCQSTDMTTLHPKVLEYAREMGKYMARYCRHNNPEEPDFWTPTRLNINSYRGQFHTQDNRAMFLINNSYRLQCQRA